MAEGAVRELYEEVGIKASVEDLRLMGSYLGKKAYVLSYLLALDFLPEIHLQPSEVVGYLLVTSSELEELADQLCEGCKNRYFMFKDQIF
jgi:8-oxo-dGTP pyrophosphatase MutT (NUDIX family)